MCYRHVTSGGGYNEKLCGRERGLNAPPFLLLERFPPTAGPTVTLCSIAHGLSLLSFHTDMTEIQLKDEKLPVIHPFIYVQRPKEIS